MAVRTNSASVQAILGGNYDGVTTLTPFIDAASSIVDDVASCASDAGTPLSSAKLELIERWLSAHCYAHMDQTFASKGTEGASASFHGQTGMYLASTRYGQFATTLDPTGCLQSVAGGQVSRAGGFWLGKTPSEQIAYEDRR